MTETIEALKKAPEMTSDPTPGPWTIKRLSRKMTITGNIHQIVSDGDFPTAFVPAWDAPQKGEEDGTAEAIANAYLISAAPDLLEALQLAEELYQIGILSAPDGLLERVVTLRRSAISKATGGAE